jgi:predicted HTH transcriptional regulator
MDFCTAHFGKTLKELSIQDIKSYFLEERIETDQLEFKSINSIGNINDKFAGIQRTVCAFLNSSGGLLIWGAPEGLKVEGKKEKIFKGDLSLFNQILEKDFVVSKISDSIIPLPNNIRTNIIIDGSKSIIIIEIDSSEYSPHQNADTYYMRIDGQTKPAPHHYIEALFKKITYPNIEAFLKITKIEVFQGNKYKVDFDMYYFNWTPLQNEEKLSFRVVSDGVFGHYQNPQHSYLYTMEGHEYFKENVKDVFYFGESFHHENHVNMNLTLVTFM